MKKLICKILGHNYKYNSKTYPTKCNCTRCEKKWITIKNPEYNGKNLLEQPIFIWIENE